MSSALDFCAAVQASGFIAMDMSIRNTAGPNGHQAVALRVGGDQSAFSGLSIEGYQVPILLRTYMFQTQKICSEIETKSTKMKLNSLSHECLIYC
jgi:pectin methylesterase-like acyl-CoA thioesterase